MTKQQCKNLEDLLTERLNIIDAYNQKSDIVFFKGMVTTLAALGYDYIEDDEGIKILKV